jgi:hypothetical protein
MFIRYLVSITQVLKDTYFGLQNWCECGLFYMDYYFRIRLRENMMKQANEIKELREANLRLTAEKAVLKLLITEHMKKCPNANDLSKTMF